MATDSEFYPKDDHSWKTWMFQEYLQVRGPLTEENVMEYFEESFLFDRSSNNNVLRMQTQHADPNYRMSRAATENELKRFTGLEYALVHAQPPLFVIQRRDRLSPTEVRPTAVYFILNNVLYSSPDLYTLLSVKLTNALNLIQSSLDTLRAARPDYTPRIGHVWPIVEAPSSSSKTPGAPKPTSAGRQSSLAPGTPAESSQLLKQAVPQGQPHPESSKAAQENKEKQAWEPFAYAFHDTRLEMDRRRMQTLAAATAAGMASVSGPGAFPPVTGMSGIQGSTGARPGNSMGAALEGRLAGEMGVVADPRSRAGGESSRRPTGLNLSPITSPEGSFPSSSTARPVPNVPTADAPKTKGAPGPPGKPGHGKKKQRRIEKQAMKQGFAQTPIPATPAP